MDVVAELVIGTWIGFADAPRTVDRGSTSVIVQGEAVGGDGVVGDGVDGESVSVGDRGGRQSLVADGGRGGGGWTGRQAFRLVCVRTSGWPRRRAPKGNRVPTRWSSTA